MTVAEIINQIRAEYGQRHQITEDQALLTLNAIQRMALDNDLEAFMYYDNFQLVDNGSGPYDFPTEPPCRKFVGLTKWTKAQLLGWTSYGSPADSDYGFNDSGLLNSRATYLPVEVNTLDRTFSFLEDPSTDSDIYRIVYYRAPKEIRNTLDDGRLIIPEPYHYSLAIMASIKLADFYVLGESVPRERLNTFFQPWWDSLEGVTDPNGNDYISEGQVGP